MSGLAFLPPPIPTLAAPLSGMVMTLRCRGGCTDFLAPRTIVSRCRATLRVPGGTRLLSGSALRTYSRTIRPRFVLGCATQALDLVGLELARLPLGQAVERNG